MIQVPVFPKYSNLKPMEGYISPAWLAGPNKEEEGNLCRYSSTYSSSAVLCSECICVAVLSLGSNSTRAYRYITRCCWYK